MGLSEGSLVLAIFYVDNKRYRAKIEKIGNYENGDKFFKVRFIDYGNWSEVSCRDLYSWDPDLEIIPAQAVCCKLTHLERFKSPIKEGTREHDDFVKVMTSKSPFCVTVKEIFHSRDLIFKVNGNIVPEIAVKIHKDDKNIYSYLKSSSALKSIIIENLVPVPVSTPFDPFSSKTSEDISQALCKVRIDCLSKSWIA